MISEQQSISMSNFYNYQQHGFSGVPPPPPPSYHSTQHQQPPPAQPVVVPPQPAPLRVVMPSLVVPSLNVVRAHQPPPVAATPVYVPQPPPAPAPTHAPAPAMHYQQQLTNPVPATADSLVDDLVNQIRSMPSIVKPPQPHSVLQSAVGGLFGRRTNQCGVKFSAVLDAAVTAKRIGCKDQDKLISDCVVWLIDGSGAEPVYVPPAPRARTEEANALPSAAYHLVEQLVRKIRSMPSIVKPPQPHSVLLSTVGGTFGQLTKQLGVKFSDVVEAAVAAQRIGRRDDDKRGRSDFVVWVIDGNSAATAVYVPPVPPPAYAPAPAMQHHQQQLTNPLPATADSLVNSLVDQIRSMPSMLGPTQPHTASYQDLGVAFGVFTKKFGVKFSAVVDAAVDAKRVGFSGPRGPTGGLWIIDENRAAADSSSQRTERRHGRDDRKQAGGDGFDNILRSPQRSPERSPDGVAAAASGVSNSSVKAAVPDAAATAAVAAVAAKTGRSDVKERLAMLRKKTEQHKEDAGVSGASFSATAAAADSSSTGHGALNASSAATSGAPSSVARFGDTVLVDRLLAGRYHSFSDPPSALPAPGSDEATRLESTLPISSISASMHRAARDFRAVVPGAVEVNNVPGAFVERARCALLSGDLSSFSLSSVSTFANGFVERRWQ